MHVNKREQQAVGPIQLFPGRASGLQDMASSGCDLPPSESFTLAPPEATSSRYDANLDHGKYAEWNKMSLKSLFAASPPPISQPSSTALYILLLALCSTSSAMNISLPWENLMKVIHCHPVLYWDVRTPWINGLHEMLPLSASSEKLPLPFAEKVNIIKWRLLPTKWEWHCRLRAL